ncbi:MAG: DUF1934 domain-containing protein [Lachnospiraceae bacterium]|nr:DUF1934 domain-containing protein [Lachnospiraceae bacterium]
MTKDAIISITGLQFETDVDEAIEVVSRGEYHFKNGKHFLTYEEFMEEENASSRCIMKISQNVVELTKKGASNVHMLFEKGSTNMTYYNTPYGELLLTITTQEIKLTEEEHQISLLLRYNLDMNYQHVSECELRVRVDAVAKEI